MAAQELIKRIRTVATSEGLEKLVADLRAGSAANAQFSESGNVVSITTARLSREQLSAANAFEATRKRVDEAYRNFVRYRTEVANVARAVEQGKASQEEANRTLELAAIKYKQVATEQDNFVRVQDAYNARARAFREALDPAFAAQNRFNAAIYEAEDLYTAGAISVDLYTKAVRDARNEIDAFKSAQSAAIGEQSKKSQDFFNSRFANNSAGRVVQSGSLIQQEPDSAITSSKSGRGIDAFDAKARAQDIAAYGAALDAAQAEYDGLFAAQNDYTTGLQELKRALDVGAISEDVYTKRLYEKKAAFADVMREMGRISPNERKFNSDFDAATAENRARDAGNAAAAAAAGEIATYPDQIKRTREEIIPLEKAQNAYRDSLKRINEEAKQGVLTEKERDAAIQRTKKAFAEQVKYLQGAGLAAGSASKNFRLTSYELTNLSYQLNDMGTMLAAGSSPFQVLATQGGQVYQILSGTRGGLKEGVKSLVEQVRGFITPARAAAGALAAIGVAAAASYSSWLDDQKKLENALNGLGRNLGTTAGELDRVSVAGASAASISVSSARDMSVVLANTGKIGTGLYEDLIVASRNYARVAGKEPVEAAEKLAEAFADPAAGAAELDKQLNFLDQSTLDLIRSLTNAGRRLEAQQLLSRKLNETLPDAAKNLSVLERAWNAVANAVSRASNAVGAGISQIVDGKTEDQLYKEAQDRLSRARGAQSGPYAGKLGINSTAQMRADEETIRQIEERRRQRQADGERARAQQQEKDAVAAARSADPRYAELEGLTKQITATQAVIAKNRQGNAQFDEMWGGTSQTVQDLETHLSGLKNRYNELADSQGMLKPVTESMRKEMDLQLAVVSATTQAERNRAQAALDEYRARAAGSNDAVVAATKENSLLQSNAELNAQLAQSQRDRIRSAGEAVTAQQLEVALIGKTAGEAAVLRANYQALVDLQREAAQSGTGFDQAKYEAIKKQNEALREQVELMARTSLREQVGFDIDQLGRTKVDQTIASTQRSMGLAVDLSSYDANLIRTREYLSEIKDASSEAFTGLASDLRRGVSAGEAVNSVLDRMLDRLLNLASDQAISDLFKSGTNGGNGGIFGSIISAFSGMFGGGKADGGLVRGPGSDTSDTAGLFALSNHEFVVNAKATRRYLPFLEAINSGRLGRMATGGLVSGSTSSDAMSQRAAGYVDGGYAAMANAVAAPANLNMQVNVQTLPGTTADVQPRQNADGTLSLEVIMKQVDKRIDHRVTSDYQNRGVISRAAEGAFGLTRKLV